MMFKQERILLIVFFARMLIHDRFARMFIYFHKIFNSKVSLPNAFVNVPRRKNFEHSGFFEKITITVT